MVTGRVPFEGDTPFTIGMKHKGEMPKNPKELNAQISDDLNRVILRCLEKDKEKRYQSTDDVRAELENIQKGIPTPEREIPPKKLKTPKTSKSKRKNIIIFGGVNVIFILLVILGILLLTKPSEEINSIAVLPLKNLSGDPAQEYFADGMTNALIGELAQVSALRVISRTSVMRFKDTEMSLPEIASKLKVDVVVEGTVIRADDRVRIMAQLVKAEPEQNLWANDYERDLSNILTLQKEVAMAIAKEIQVTLTQEEKERLESKQMVNIEAYEAYLLGRHFYNKHTEKDVRKSIEYFEQSIDNDPNYALAYVGLANCYTNLSFNTWISPEEAYPKTKAAVMKALELDETLGESYTALGFIKFFFEWDLYGAELDFQRALELSPGSVEVYELYSSYLAMMGRVDEAITMCKRALELDPVASSTVQWLGWIYFLAGRHDQSIIQLKKALELDPNCYWAHVELPWNYALKGMYNEAIAHANKVMNLFPAGDPAILASIGWVYGVSGKREDALKLLGRIKELSSKIYLDPYMVAIIYAGLGDKDKAFEWLMKGYEHRSSSMLFLKIDPKFDNLRSDTRFGELLKKVGFSQ
jgi:TolB-like protein/Flp pilus assembly protein TadD